MKKLVHAGILLMPLFFLLSCQQQKQPSAEPSTESTSGAPAGGPPTSMARKVQLDGTAPTLDQINAMKEMGYSDPFTSGLISFDAADSMSKLYRMDTRKASFISDPEPGSRVSFIKRDATSIWFTLDELKGFVQKIEACQPKRKGAYKPQLGIRIYYAKYPHSLTNFTTLSGLSPDVAGMHTLFMVPTYNDTALHLNVDFNVDFVGSDSSHPVPYYKLSPEQKKTASILGFQPPVWRDMVRVNTARTTGSISRDVIINHGGLSPPPDSLGSFPTPAGN